MKDRMVAKRWINLFLMLLVMLAATTVPGVLHSLWIDEILGLLVLDLVFFVLFVFVLEHERSRRALSGNKETDYRIVLTGLLISTVIVLISSFLPEFLKPVILITILMSAFGSQMMSICVGVFLTGMMGMIAESGTQELVLCFLMLLSGCILAEAMENTEAKFWHYIVILCLSVMLPGVFYYLTYQEVNMMLFLYGTLEGIAVDAFLLLFFNRIVAEKNSEVADTLEDILDDAYPTARELAGFSKADFKHARRVSALAEKCARLVGADAKVCAAAGFYYRIGIVEGEPIAASGVKIAQKECFPENVIRIISEYNGEQELPSTIVSAIVHMVDGLIKKLEVLDSQTMSSEWNQDMVIYQTLNEFSAKGLYDKSGLSMNMFLNIREYLVKEEALL